MGTKSKRKQARRGYVPARAREVLAPGESVRIARELQEMTQEELADASGIAQSTISSIESSRVTLGAERAERLARALKVHPAVLLWPNWNVDIEGAKSGARESRSERGHGKERTV
jgi:transcriptional regulator with XRE-family HTH domain